MSEIRLLRILNDVLEAIERASRGIRSADSVLGTNAFLDADNELANWHAKLGPDEHPKDVQIVVRRGCDLPGFVRCETVPAKESVNVDIAKIFRKEAGRHE